MPHPLEMVPRAPPFRDGAPVPHPLEVVPPCPTLYTAGSNSSSNSKVCYYCYYCPRPTKSPE